MGEICWATSIGSFQMIRLILLTTFGFFASVGILLADAKVPTKDIDGASDSDVVGRLAGAFIIDYYSTDFDEAEFPLTPIKQIKGPRNKHNNYVYKPDDSITLEGKRTRIVYLNGSNDSPLKVVRSYEKELKAKGGKVLFSCKGDECGGGTRAYGGGGNHMSLGHVLWDRERISRPNFSNGSCAQFGSAKDQRYTLVHVPAENAYISIHAYRYGGGTFCNKIAGYTVSAVDVVQVAELEAEFVTIKAEEMASEITTSGRIALYGILFDSGKAKLKPESKATLDEIGALLKQDASLRLLIVGHTDTEGAYDFNLDLSQRRAKSVVDDLVGTYGIGRERLFPVGVSFASPVATNDTEEGRAKNRRVELVKF